MRRILLNSWFLIVLCCAMAIGLGLSSALAPLSAKVSREVVIGVVMLATSLSMDFRRLTAGRGNWIAVALACVVNSALAPPLGWLAGRLLSSALAQGLIIAMCVPCTIASAIVWTRRGAGNDAATAMVTLLTNFGCFLVLPFWTGLLLGESTSADPVALVWKLLACVAAPMLAGQLLRLAAPVAAWSERHKQGISLLAQWGVLSLAFFGAVDAGQAMLTSDARPAPLDWLALLAVVSVLHISLATLGWLAATTVGLAPPERLTVLIAGSQKTLAVGLGVASHFGPMALFPLVTYHMTQLFIDTVIVDRWRRVHDQQGK
ncbi:MAG: bile acid:sodium symporter [Planctomycetales bacterium]|nr:bile acid:sodium symporter [Planctomycetales bacterium]